MKPKMIILILAIAALSSGLTYKIAATRTSAPNAAGEETHEAPGAEAVRIPGLKTSVAVAGEGWDALVLNGRIAVPSDRLVKISPRIGGKVIAAYPDVGDSVRRGQLVAMISSVDLAEARASYRQALARLNAARKNLAQEQQMVRMGGLSVRPLEEARAEAVRAQGELADAKGDLAQAKSDLAKAESELVQCRAKLERAKELYADQIVSKQDLESAETEFKMDTAAVGAAKSRVSQAEGKIDKAKADVQIAQQYLAREEKVYKGRVLDTKALQTARAAVTEATNEADAAADRIRVLGANPAGSGETVAVVCPMSGQVVSRHTNPGEMAQPSDLLFTVADLSRVWVEANVYEKDLSKVRKGQSAQIRVDAYPDRVFSGRIDSIDDVLSADLRTAKVRCVVNNPHGLLKGEMFARVSLITAKRQGVVLVPKEAVLEDAGSKIVFTTCTECPEDKKYGPSACGSYDKFAVETGPTHGGRIEILKGLKPGAEVITVGQHQIKSALSSGQLKAGCKDDCGN